MKWFALLLLATLLSSPAIAADDAADQAFAKQDWPQVVILYRAQTIANSTDGKAWYRLGRGLEGTKQFVEAQAAFQHAADPKFQLPFAQFHVAANAASANNRDAAVRGIEAMADTGFQFPKVFEDDERFASLRSDPRYIAALRKIDINGAPCKDPKNPEFRQLDFWVGEWNVFDPNGNQVGTSSVQKIIGDCVIFENWTGGYGRIGKSFNKYNSADKQWEQYWVDEGPTRGYYTGHYQSKSMQYASETKDPAGKTVKNKLTFFDQPDGTVRQLFESSTDDGKTWTTGYDYSYHRKP